MKKRILLVEDSPEIVRGLSFALESEDFEVVLAQNVQEAEVAADTGGAFDCAVLDVGLPDGDGFQVCRMLRQELDIPVIFLTARDSEEDVVRGLELGAEDYVVKPFRNRELLARIRGILRRRGVTEERLTAGIVTVDPAKDRVYVGEEEVTLTALEYRILLMLFQNRDRIVTREELLEKIWDMAGNYVNDNTLTVYIRRIRGKLGAGDCIRTVKGLGYRVEG